MRLSEKILLSLSKDPGRPTKEEEFESFSSQTALNLLFRVFPKFSDVIKGKKVCDFGCGFGYQSIALAQKGAVYVLGVDTNLKRIENAQKLSERENVSAKVNFTTTIDERHLQKFDMVISQNSMEHFPDPVAIVELMKSLIKDDGQLFITFGPPWYAPHGSHMQFFTRVPWVNLLFPEKTVMNVRNYFRSDGAKRYEEVESGLNKMTVSKFEKIISQCGMQVTFRKYECIKKLDLLGQIPWARELFINHVSCVLAQKSR